MKISRKLTIMTISSIALMFLIGAIGLYVENSLDDALDDVNNRGIPGMRSIYEVTNSQWQLPSCATW